MNVTIEEYLNMALRLLGKADIDLALTQSTQARAEEENVKLKAQVASLEAALAVAQAAGPPVVH